MKKISAVAIAVSAALFSMAAAAEGFDGAYAGVYGGKAYTTDKGKEINNAGNASGWRQETQPDQWLYGVMAGYNFDLGNNIVLGLEADYEGRNNDGDTAYQTLNGQTDTDYAGSTRIKAAGSFRGRAGYVFNNPYYTKSPIMLYVTGGYAAAEAKRKYLDYQDPSINTSTTDWQDGWTAGAGVEYLLNEHFAARLEYRHSDYGTENVHDYPWSDEIKQTLTENTVHLGLSYQL